jgi:hypothetical protein
MKTSTYTIRRIRHSFSTRIITDNSGIITEFHILDENIIKYKTDSHSGFENRSYECTIPEFEYMTKINIADLMQEFGIATL